MSTALRTLYISPPWQRWLQWPTAKPDDYLDYYLDVSIALGDVEDYITSISAAISPYGTNEMSISGLNLNNYTIRVWLSGGIPGRLYKIQINIFTISGREFVWYVKVPVSKSLASYPIIPPEYPGYSPFITLSPLLGEDGMALLGENGENLLPG